MPGPKGRAAGTAEPGFCKSKENDTLRSSPFRTKADDG